MTPWITKDADEIDADALQEALDDKASLVEARL